MSTLKVNLLVKKTNKQNKTKQKQKQTKNKNKQKTKAKQTKIKKPNPPKKTQPRTFILFVILKIVVSICTVLTRFSENAIIIHRLSIYKIILYPANIYETINFKIVRRLFFCACNVIIMKCQNGLLKENTNLYIVSNRLRLIVAFLTILFLT